MKFLNQSGCGTNCCDPCGTYELEGCAAGVPFAQLTSIGSTTATRWVNLDTGEVVDTKPTGFLTGACSDSAENSLAFSATAPTLTSPFATPKDNYTAFVTSDGTAAGTIMEMWKFDLETGTWVQVPLGGEETLTTVTETVTGHKIATYTNEAGAAVEIHETVTSVANMTFDALTGAVSFEYTDEAGVVTTASAVVPVGDKYKTTSTTCNDIVSTGQQTFTVAPGLAYTPLQDIVMYHDTNNHMHGQVVSYDSATGTLVVDIHQKTGSGNHCDWTINLDAVQAATTTETTTTVTNVVNGNRIATYTNEVGAVVDIDETITALSISGNTLTYVDEAGVSNEIALPSGASALWTDATTNPAPTGNTGTLPRFVENTVTKQKWYIDSTGVAREIEAATADCGVVYFNALTPTAATIFDNENPPVANDNALRNLDCAIYIGTDGSVWSSNGTTYQTKTYNFPTEQVQVMITATANQTTFTLSKTPVGAVYGYRNGVRLAHSAFTNVGNVVTYNPSFNGGHAMDANDRVMFEYEAF